MSSCVRAVCAILCGSFLAAGCSITIDYPTNDGEYACPSVQVVGKWAAGNVSPGTFVARLGNLDVTNQFAVNYTTGQAQALLSMPPGNHTLALTGKFKNIFSSNGTMSTTTRTFTVPSLTLKASPDPFKADKATTKPLVIEASACSGPVSITLSGLPAGVTANPATFHVYNSPAAGTLSSKTVFFGKASTNLTTSASAATGNYTVTINGTQLVESASTTFIVAVAGSPSITAVSPAFQVKDGTITITGTAFDPTCSDNNVTFSTSGAGGLSVPPSTCTATSVSAVVPTQLPYGETQVTVGPAGLPSNALTFTVARQPGSFVPITADIVQQTSSGRMCSGGNFRVDVVAATTGSMTASYEKMPATGYPVGSFTFHTHTQTFNNPMGLAYGGAGFSLCSLGIVLDAVSTVQSVDVKLLDLNTGHMRTYPVRLDMPSLHVAPGIWRSQDGTIIMVQHASTIQSQVAVTYIDAVSLGLPFKVVQTTTLNALSTSALINANNEIVLTVAGTTYPAVKIP